MSTLKVVNIQHPSAASATLILDSSGNLALPAGSASTPALQGPSDTNTGLFFPAADTIAFAEGGTEVLRIDSSGRVGIGTSSPRFALSIGSTTSTGTATPDTFDLGGTYSSTNGANPKLRLYWDGSTVYGLGVSSTGDAQLDYIAGTGASHVWYIGSTERMRIGSSGAVGIGTAPSYKLDVYEASASGVDFRLRNTEGEFMIRVNDNAAIQQANTLIFRNSAEIERARIDSSGRLLVGTSSARSNIREGTDNETPKIQLESATNDYSEAGLSIINNSSSGFAPQLWLGRSASDSIGGNALVSSGRIGSISFNAADGTNFIQGARIQADIDGTSGSGDLPTRLVFSTTADGASSPTERLRIGNTGGIDVSATGNADNYLRNTAGQTTASGANMFIDGTTGVLRRSTSSIKYKTDVETLQNSYADEILKCRPVWYRSTSAYDNQQWGYWGFIAEEVAEVDPRLCFFKKNEDGSLEPEGVQYDRFVPHLLNLIKRQQQAIEDLQAEVAALKAK